jgi:hypothetical protein
VEGFDLSIRTQSRRNAEDPRKDAAIDESAERQRIDRDLLIQKFPNITDPIETLAMKGEKFVIQIAGNGFAVIVDEAHSSQSGASAMELDKILDREASRQLPPSRCRTWRRGSARDHEGSAIMQAAQALALA